MKTTSGTPLPATLASTTASSCRSRPTNRWSYGNNSCRCSLLRSSVWRQEPITGDEGYWQSGIYIEHVATGLWILGNYGREFLSDMPTQLLTSAVT